MRLKRWPCLPRKKHDTAAPCFRKALASVKQRITWPVPTVREASVRTMTVDSVMLDISLELAGRERSGPEI
jgi:hypothetical protein